MPRCEPDFPWQRVCSGERQFERAVFEPYGGSRQGCATGSGIDTPGAATHLVAHDCADIRHIQARQGACGSGLRGSSGRSGNRRRGCREGACCCRSCQSAGRHVSAGAGHGSRNRRPYGRAGKASCSNHRRNPAASGSPDRLVPDRHAWSSKPGRQPFRCTAFVPDSGGRCGTSLCCVRRPFVIPVSAPVSRSDPLSGRIVGETCCPYRQFLDPIGDSPSRFTARASRARRAGSGASGDSHA